MSDHLPNYIIISKKYKSQQFNNRPLVRLFSKANIDKFCALLRDSDWSDVYRQHDIDVCYNIFAKQLDKCFNTSFPETPLSRKRSKDKKWFTSGLKVSCRQKDKLFAKWLKSKHFDDELAYKK